MNIGLVQLQIEPGALEKNVDRACEQIRVAADRGADLVVLPELFTIGYFAFDCYDRYAEGLDGPTLDRIATVAATADVAVLAGSIVEDLGATAERAETKPPATTGFANTAVLFDATGDRQGVYRKRHLFGYDSKETALLTAGDSEAIAEVGEFTVGITTCYDLRFPEQYRRLLDRGVDLIAVVSAWPYPRVEHWQVLPRARAIENLSYVAAVNGSGTFEDATLLGRSTVYDPWGTPIAAAGEEPTIVQADIDPATIQQVRDSFPALADRR